MSGWNFVSMENYDQSTMPVIVTIIPAALDYEWLSVRFEFLNGAFYSDSDSWYASRTSTSTKISCTCSGSPSLLNDKTALANKLVQGLCSSVLQIFFAARVTLRITHIGWPTTWKSVWTDKNGSLERVWRSLYRQMRDSYAHVVGQVLLSMKSVFFIRNWMIKA